MLSQRSMVAASLASVHQPDTYSRVARTREALHCRGCGRRWGTLTTDRHITGESSWERDLCGACAWDAECPVPRRVPGTTRTA